MHGFDSTTRGTSKPFLFCFFSFVFTQAPGWRPDDEAIKQEGGPRGREADEGEARKVSGKVVRIASSFANGEAGDKTG